MKFGMQDFGKPTRFALLCILACTSTSTLGQLATGGQGLYRDSIFWFDWGPLNRIIDSDVVETRVFQIDDFQISMRCTLTAIGSPIQAYAAGFFFGDGLDELYNIGGTGLKNSLVSGLSNLEIMVDTSFEFSCSAESDGKPLRLPGLVIADSETQATTEYLRLVAPVGQWQVIDRFRIPTCTRSSAAILNGNELTLTNLNGYCAGGPMAVYFLNGGFGASVTIHEFDISAKGAIAIGIVADGTDRGDAPASYGGAGHLLLGGFSGGLIEQGTTSNLNEPAFSIAIKDNAKPALGELVDPDTMEQHSENADGDDSFEMDDEDAFAGSVLPHTGKLNPGDTYPLSIPCEGPGVVAGWVDWNQDGLFEPVGEAAATSNCDNSVAELRWSVPADLKEGWTYIRLRISTDSEAIASPSGLAIDGEVEDYRLYVGPAEIEVTKTGPSAPVFPNSAARYIISVRNVGDVNPVGTRIQDSIPTGITSYLWNCSEEMGAICPTRSGAGPIDELVSDLPPKGRLVYILDGVVAPHPPTMVENTVNVILSPRDRCSPGQTMPPCVATTSALSAGQIHIQLDQEPDSVRPDGEVLYQIILAHAGGVQADGMQIVNPMPEGIQSYNWTCSGTGGATCPDFSGQGPIAAQLGAFPAGGQLTYSIAAQVAPRPPASILNTVQITPGNNAYCSGGCIETTSASVIFAAVEVSMLSKLGTGALAAMLALAGIALIVRLR